MDTKQVIIVRKDLKMRKGKMCAQAAHASMGVITNLFNYKTTLLMNTKVTFFIKFESPLIQWLENSFTKIVVGCDSEEELHELKRKADELHILNCLIKDSGRTEFKEPTYTCIAIGPDFNEKIDLLTKNFSLL